MKIDIKGHSGCNIDIVEIDNKLYVKKSTKDQKYKERLYKQGTKQKYDKLIKNPYIHELIIDEDGSHILMDYIYAKNFIDFLENASPVDIDHLINKIALYIIEEYKLTKPAECKREEFINKFKSIKENCQNNPLTKDSTRVSLILNKCESMFSKGLPESFTIMKGTCHGDLTFSNMLFTSNDIYFIDYLDSFIETPLQDIVKLRQDTRYHWSTMMYQKKYDIVRLNMILDYIDKQLDDTFKELFEDYEKYYSVFQIMNILRILPYVKEDRIKYFVLNVLESLI